MSEVFKVGQKVICHTKNSVCPGQVATVIVIDPFGPGLKSGTHYTVVYDDGFSWDYFHDSLTPLSVEPVILEDFL